MATKKIAELTNEELREVSLRKNSKGIATKEALAAQKLLHIQNGCCYEVNNNNTYVTVYGSNGKKKRSVNMSQYY